MNTFELEIFDDQFPLVTFYTVRWEGGEYSETEKFARRFFNHDVYGDDYDQIAYLIQLMGEEYGADSSFFNRDEDEASALPPEPKGKIRYIVIPLKDNKLRLYCVRVNDNIVVLFNGGIKSSLTNQESEDIMPKFRDAKYFAKRIWEEIHDEMIVIDEAHHRLQSFDGSNEVIIQ